MASKLELAQRLKAQLDAVATNAQARAVAQAWVDASLEASGQLGGFQGGMVDMQVISPDVSLLIQQREGFPGDDQGVELALWEGPAGMRRTIGRVAAGAWAIKEVFPQGTSIVTDLGDVDLAGGAEQVAGWAEAAIEKVAAVAGDVTGGILKGLWPVLLVAAVVVVGAVVISRKVPG